jgi:hypothetical protein
MEPRWKELLEMKRTIFAAAALLASAALTTLPANAEFILADNVFADLGATGFGNAPRLLTLGGGSIIDTQSNGAVVSAGGTEQFLTNIVIGPSPAFTVTGVVCTNNNTCGPGGLETQDKKSSLVDVSTLWATGFNVGVGLDTNQTGSTTGLLFNELVLNIYTSTGLLIGTFGGNDAVLITQAQLAAQQGNGNSVFNLALTPNEQAEFDQMRLDHPGSIFAGLAASFGCVSVIEPGANCIGQTIDGQESFLAFNQVPGPIVGAGLPGIIAACGMMFGLNRWRRRRDGEIAA